MPEEHKLEDPTAQSLHGIVLAQMQKLDLARIDVDYSGEGDSGCMDSAAAITKHPGLVDLEEIPVGVLPAYSCYAAPARADRRPDGTYEFVRTYSQTDQNLAEIAMEVADCAVWEKHEGWYNDNGATGTVTLHADGRIEVAHEWGDDEEDFNEDE